MWKHNVFRFGRKRRYKPAEKNSRGASAEELRYYKARHVGRPNPGKGVHERSCKRYRWIGKGGGSRKPVWGIFQQRYVKRHGIIAPDTVLLPPAWLQDIHESFSLSLVLGKCANPEARFRF